MFGTSVIVFREVLEAAIIIGIIAAATRGIPGSRRWMIAGVLAGLAGSAVLARFADVIGSLASGIGQAQHLDGLTRCRAGERCTCSRK